MRSLIYSLASAVMFVGHLASQDLLSKAPAQTIPILIENATIHPVTRSRIEKGWVLIIAGKIHSLGAGKPAQTPSKTERIDAHGEHVYPGLISAVTQLGLSEVGAVRSTQDHQELGEIKPEVRAAVAVNPDSTLIPVARSNGILVAGVFPTGGRIPGRASIIHLDGWTSEDMTIEAEAGMVVSWPARQSSSRRRHRGQDSTSDNNADKLRREMAETFTEARAYLASRRADPDMPTDLRWEAFASIFSRKGHSQRPVFILANEIEQIESAVSWAINEGLKPVLIGGRDAPLCADLLVRHDVPVVVTGTHKTPKRRDSVFEEAFALPATLDKAGVRWCLASNGSVYNERNLPYHAATAVAFGLSQAAALRSITLSAAEILGVGDRLGSLDPGKSATLLITSGNPMEITTNVTAAFIDGRRVDLRNKQTELAKKYREKYRQLGLIK
ncbi:MAG: amidohydrolase family protein [Planctomycetota bacterium]|nr:amidohydrolase family protein [Planctomycetota bacterium]